MGNDELEKKEVMWYKVYHELAKELAKKNTKELQKEFYEKCMNDKDFREQHNWTQVLEKSKHWYKNTDETRVKWGVHHYAKEDKQYPVERFDPMQIFASFNGFGMKEESRIRKINIYFRLLGSEKCYSEEKKEIDFTGCPAPMILALILMRYPKQVTILWDAFIAVMLSNKNEEVNKNKEVDFEEIKECHGVSVESFTVLLFWIDSRNFLPLDKNTLALFETNNKEIKYDTWEEYITFLTEEDRPKPTDTYRVIARMAWNCTSELLSEYKDGLDQFGIKKCPNKSLKIIAIKPLEGCNEKFLKGLKKDQIYLFDKAYTINENETIIYDKKKDIQLFNQDRLQVNITAIVGKNGTGKSTLIELLLAVINNVNYQKKKKCVEYIPKLKVELIFEDLAIYKIIINEREIQLKKYEDNEWNEDSIRSKKFFYNILVNYTIHSLNSSEKNWIEPHFENNCNTDTGIAIEPFRKDGNINIQKEEESVKQRLITNLLEPELEKDGYSFRQLTETYKAIKLVSSTKLRKSIKNEEIVSLYSKTSNLQDCYNEHNIENLSNKIKEKKEENKSIEDFIPNNYFTDIILENDIEFSDLSSGEKQKIYSINSIVYHIQRLDKKKYKHINLILDEIELYFHPELQRTYIHDIIEAIKKIDPINILGINITFITHSPFILSDIPESKILFLDKESNDADAKTVPTKRDIKTFGANIHNLLSNGFFMNGKLMGEFAFKKIQGIVDFYNSVKDGKETLETYKLKREEFHAIRDNIGEEYIKGVITNHIEFVEEKLEDDEFKNRRIKQLKKELKKLGAKYDTD